MAIRVSPSGEGKDFHSKLCKWMKAFFECFAGQHLWRLPEARCIGVGANAEDPLLVTLYEDFKCLFHFPFFFAAATSVSSLAGSRKEAMVASGASDVVPQRWMAIPASPCAFRMAMAIFKLLAGAARHSIRLHRC